LKIFFASGSKGALTPLTKILRTFLSAAFHVNPMSFKSFRALEIFFQFSGCLLGFLLGARDANVPVDCEKALIKLDGA